MKPEIRFHIRDSQQRTPVWIGPGAQIGANAVVIHDVPAGAIAVGVPATIRLRPKAAPFDVEIDDPAIYI